MNAPVSEPRRVSSKLTNYDQGELQWFFSRGQTAFERSTIGPMLEHAAQFNFDSVARSMRARGETVHRSSGDITARPTAEVRTPGGYEPDRKTLERYARVSRRLRTIRAEWPDGVKVLEAFFGDAGCRFGETQHTRMLSVYPLTPSGKRLLKLTYNAQVELSDHERIGVQAELERLPGQSKMRRKALLRRADMEAIKMLREAGRTWNKAGLKA